MTDDCHGDCSGRGGKRRPKVVGRGPCQWCRVALSGGEMSPSKVLRWSWPPFGVTIFSVHWLDRFLFCRIRFSSRTVLVLFLIWKSFRPITTRTRRTWSKPWLCRNPPLLVNELIWDDYVVVGCSCSNGYISMYCK